VTHGALDAADLLARSGILESVVPLRALLRAHLAGFTSACALVAGCGRVGFDGVTVGDAAIDALMIDPRLVVWLPMDTDPNAGIVDLARGHTATCVGTCPTAIPGVRAGAYDLRQQPIALPHVADLDTSAGFTIAGWVRFHRYNGLNQNLICKPLGPPANAGNSYCLSIDASGTIIYYTNSVVGAEDYRPGSRVPSGEWHHLAMSWDGSFKRGYLDGATDFATSGIAVGFDTNYVIIGADNVAPDLFLDGDLDDLRIYDAALSAAEIAALAVP
jgi:hypothetical protein